MLDTRHYRTFVIFALSFALVLFVGKAYYDTNTIEVKHYQIKESSLGEALAGLKVAFLSDLHIRKIDVRENKILEILHEEKPDLILLSGDYISFKGPYEPVMSFFHQFKAPYGVYGVLGNTEYSNENGSCILCHHEKSTLRLPGLILRLRSGQAAWDRPRPETSPNLSTLSRSRPKGSVESLRPRGSGLTLSGDSIPRFQREDLPSTRAQAEGAPPNGSKSLKEKQNPIFLRNSASFFEANHKKINILGVDDPVNKKSDLKTTLKRANLSGPSILLAHSPEIFEEASGYGIDLVLCGHNHGGQIFITKILRKILPFDPVLEYLGGFFQKEKTLMYVSRGVGTSYLPFRLGVKPEITFFEFSANSTNSSNSINPSNPINTFSISNNPPKTTFAGLSLSNFIETFNIFDVIRGKFARRHSVNSNVFLDFESDEDLKRLNWECHKWFELSEEHATSGKQSLKVSLPPGQYPGINFEKVKKNWSEGNYFGMDVFNPSEERIAFHIRIDDNKSGWEYADRFDINFELKQGINHISIPTDSIRTNIHHRPLNLKRIKRMMVFIPNNPKKRELYIDNIRLE
jgi:predicted MPP superfamily phosphohydrolase